MNSPPFEVLTGASAQAGVEKDVVNGNLSPHHNVANVRYTNAVMKFFVDNPSIRIA
jgi:hypothetical protein